MKPCDGCDGSGIMWLQMDDGNTKAPCLICSPGRTLEDLEYELSKKITSQELFQERVAIREHNKRMEGK